MALTWWQTRSCNEKFSLCYWHRLMNSVLSTSFIDTGLKKDGETSSRCVKQGVRT